MKKQLLAPETEGSRPPVPELGFSMKEASQRNRRQRHSSRPIRQPKREAQRLSLAAALRRSSPAGNTEMVHKFCDVTSLEQAVQKAKEAGAQHVIVVPLNGDIQRAGLELSNPTVAFGLAIAFEGPKSTHDQLGRLEAWLERGGLNV